MANMSISADVKNPNSVEVEAVLTFWVYGPFGLPVGLGQTTEIVLEGSDVKTVLIPANSEETVTFTLTDYAEDSRFIIDVRFDPTANSEDTHTRSYTQRIVDGAYVKPFTDITQNYIAMDGGNGTGSDWGIDFTVQQTTYECENEVRSDITERDATRTYPIVYNTQDQHRVNYTLISGASMQSQSGTELGIGQYDEVKIVVEDVTNPEWNRKIIRMYEAAAWDQGSISGTFSIQTDIEVKNPIKNEWSVYSPRVYRTEEYSWSIIG